MRRELFYGAAVVAVVIVILACSLQDGAYAYKFILCVLATLVVAAAASVALEPVDAPPPELGGSAARGVRAALAALTGAPAEGAPSADAAPSSSAVPPTTEGAPQGAVPALDDLFHNGGGLSTREGALHDLCAEAEEKGPLWSDYGEVAPAHDESAGDSAPDMVDRHEQMSRMPEHSAPSQYVAVEPHAQVAREYAMVTRAVKRQETLLEEAKQRYNHVPSARDYDRAFERYVTTMAIEADNLRQKNTGGLSRVAAPKG